MINKQIPLNVLRDAQSLSKQGLITSEERKTVSEACKSYTRTGDDDEFYEFLERFSETASSKVVRNYFQLKKEELYNDNN